MAREKRLSDSVTFEEKSYGAIVERDAPGDENEKVKLTTHEIEQLAEKVQR